MASDEKAAQDLDEAAQDARMTHVEAVAAEA
jgi:hypothetical protein